VFEAAEVHHQAGQTRVRGRRKGLAEVLQGLVGLDSSMFFGEAGFGTGSAMDVFRFSPLVHLPVCTIFGLLPLDISTWAF
jgi:hypothetical protein